ncbi:MAG: methyltransferase domain-containing protein [Proteobacteria bacterium]|nr:methyltransferase domain-containing protein [Pseudomonadota bacterium]
MIFNKNLIAENFSRGSKTYDEAAQVQLSEARELVALISPYLKKDSRILDLGSGTSFIAKQLATYEITEVDISVEMLNSWRDRPSNIKAIQADFENLPFAENSFDLIVSSFALQWSSDFEKNFSRFFSLLRPGGVFAFCLPTNGSLPELSAFNINEFPNNFLIKDALNKSGFNVEFFVQKTVQQNFLNKREAVIFLKRIGANSPTKTRLPLKASLSKNISPQFSWNISHFICSKK